MKNSLFILIILLGVITNVNAQTKTQSQIRSVLAQQNAAWNRGDIPGFMEGYWKSDSLMFIGKSGVTYGWQQTLDNYKKGYPDTASMGKLKFDLLEIRQISPDHCWVLGKWHLYRSIGDVGGAFTLLFRKIKNRWLIVADHSS